jgi:hypothetical protein
MNDRTAKRHGIHEATRACRTLVPPPEGPDRASDEVDEVLVADPRGGMTPSQVIGQKLGSLLLAASYLGAGEAGRAEDARHLLGRGGAPQDSSAG